MHRSITALRLGSTLGRFVIIGSLITLSVGASFAQVSRPDATNIQMVTMGETYCRSIDNEDKSSIDFYTSAADVTAKSGKVIQSHNGGNCCTAAAPWNGSACAAPLICAAGTEAVNGSCVATTASCAAIGMTLINGACGVAAPTIPSGTLCGSVKGLIKGGSTVYAEGYTMFKAVVQPGAPAYQAMGGKFYLPESSVQCSGANIYSAAITPYLISCPAGYSNYKMTALAGNYLSHLGAMNFFTFRCVKD